MTSPDDTLVDAGELHGGVLELGLDDPTCGRAGTELDRPAPQRGHALVRSESTAVEDAIVSHHVHDDATGAVGSDLVVGVEWMEDVAGLDVEPPQAVQPGPSTRQHADARSVTGIPGIGERRAGHRVVEVEGHRQVVEHGEVLGDRHVVHHRATGDRDVLAAHDPTVPGDDRVLDDLGSRPEVAGGVQLTGDRVELRVGGVPVRQCAVEVASADRRQLVVHLDRFGARLDDGEGPAAEPDDIGVRSVVHPLGTGAAGVGLSESGRHTTGSDPPVAVPLGATVAQADAVHHAVAGEPVVSRRVRIDRVGSVAQVPTVQLARQCAGDFEVERGDLCVDGPEVPLQVRIAGHHSAGPQIGESFVDRHRNTPVQRPCSRRRTTRW